MQFHPRTLIGRLLIAAIAIIGALGASAFAQSDEETEKALEKYRQMLKRSVLEPRIPRRRSRRGAVEPQARRQERLARELRSRRGSGQARGRLRRLPRYFADADKVHGPRAAAAVVHGDAAEARHQGRRQPAASPAPAARSGHGGSRRVRRQQILGAEDRPSRSRIPRRRRRYALGEAMFFRRSAIMDFACATCHAEDGKRIRLQALPDLSRADQAAQGDDGRVADLPGVAGSAHDHAAPALGLLSGRCACRRRIMAPTADGAHRRISPSRPRAATSTAPVDQALTRRHGMKGASLARRLALAAATGSRAALTPRSIRRSSTAIKST